jgi:hypothetical protein
VYRATKQWRCELRQTTLKQIEFCVTALTSVQQDCVTHWIDALRYAITDHDPVRASALLRSLLGSAFPTKPETKAAAAAAIFKSPAAQSKRFQFLFPVMFELGWRARAFSTAILQHVTTAALQPNAASATAVNFLQSPFKQVRDMTGQLLACLTNINFGRRDANVAKLLSLCATRSASIDANQATAELSSSSSSSSLSSSLEKKNNSSSSSSTATLQAELNSTDKLFVESVLYYVIRGLAFGSSLTFSAAMLQLLPIVLHNVHHADKECAGLAGLASQVCAWSECSAVNMPLMLDTLGAAAKHRSWRVRLGVLNFLNAFVPRHSAVLAVLDPDAEAKRSDVAVEAKQSKAAKRRSKCLASATKSGSVRRILDMVTLLLADSSLEVRSKASESLTCVLMSLPLVVAAVVEEKKQQQQQQQQLFSIDLLCLKQWFVKLASSKQRKKKASNSVDDNDDAKAAAMLSAKKRVARDISRHAGVLGLFAICNSFPYALPDPLPEVLSFLAVEHARGQFGAQTRAFFAAYRKTKHDEWDSKYALCFSAMQLQSINAVDISPSYIA